MKKGFTLVELLVLLPVLIYGMLLVLLFINSKARLWFLLTASLNSYQFVI